ncbi:MAG: FIST C-terminal domain-containing protein [Chromatiales bacterium]|nr:FIST C-terminal domain-containing protein [Chromatiales bacterium]
MIVKKLSFLPSDTQSASVLKDTDPDLIISFGAPAESGMQSVFTTLKTHCPRAIVIGCTTNGQILEKELLDDETVCIAIRFEATPIRHASVIIGAMDDSRACGQALARQLNAPDLAGVFVLSSGLHVNGSQLLAGMVDVLGMAAPITGGLAGDAGKFIETFVVADAPPQAHAVSAIGFYGNVIRIGHGTAGGWSAFGSWRQITRSEGGTLYELDGKPALDIYEHYLGDEAADLPTSALLFPLQIEAPGNSKHQLIRTILGIDRDKKSLRCAGDIPQGWKVRLMYSAFYDLNVAATKAARLATANVASQTAEGVALMVSCIGRRMVMGQMITDEIEAVCSELGERFSMVGFYSYGELAPHELSGICELHNQSITITTLTEVDA